MDRILVVEDSVGLREELVGLIKDVCHDCLIDAVRNEAEAAERLNNFLYSVVLTDVDLSKGDGQELGGFEVVKVAKRDEPDRPVIVVTSKPGDQHPHELRHYDGVAYVVRKGASSSPHRQLVPAYVQAGLRRWKDAQARRLTIILPDGSGEQIFFKVELADAAMSKTRKRFALDFPFVREAAAQLGSLIGTGELDQFSVLSQLLGRHLWDRLFGEHEELLIALGRATCLPLRLESGAESLDIPFELLHDGEGFLARRQPLVRVVRNRRVGPENEIRTWDKSRVLLVAADTCSRELPFIPDVDQEIERILSICVASGMKPEIVRSCESSRDRVEDKLKVARDIVHLAGHARHNSQNPGLSKIFFWPKQCDEVNWRSVRAKGLESETGWWIDATAMRGDLAWLTAHEVADRLRQSRPWLVYLSCCHSGQSGGSAARSFSESLGLSDAVVQVGVPIAVGHRWPVVDDKSSVNAVAEFYKRLAAGYPPERAMFWARRAVDQSHPSWASAVMIDQRQ